MKKLGFALLSLMVVVLLVNSLEADAPEWSGSMEMPFAYRSGEMADVLDAGGTEMDFILAPLITLDMKWALADKVTGFLQLENQRLFGLGTDANVGPAGSDNIFLAVEQAFIKVEGFLREKLSLKFGTQDLKFTLRKGEGAFFIDVAESENIGFPDVIDVAGFIPVFKNTQEFAGLTCDFGSLADDNYAALVFWGVVNETGTDAADGDDKVFGINLDYKLPNDDKNVLKVLLANVANAHWDANIMTIGVGADYFGLVENLEVYAEFYTQSGDYETDVDQAGQAFRVGGKYDFQHELKPYVDLSMWDLSGDKDLDWTDDENGAFVTFENVQSTLILEDNLFGLDLDSNYTAIKIEAGIETSFDINGDGAAEPVSVKLLFGQFTANETDPADDDDALGTEIDITATLHYTENLTFNVAIGMLSGGDFFDGRIADTDSMTFFSFGAGIKF